MDLGWLWWVTLRSSLVKQTNKQKITFLLSDVDNGRGYACVMDKGYVENLYTFLFYIAMILKLLQKKKN